MPDPDSVVDPGLPTYSHPSDEEVPASASEHDDSDQGAAIDPQADTSAGFHNDAQISEPAASSDLYAKLDALFPEDPAHPAHNRPLVDRVRDALRAIAEKL